MSKYKRYMHYSHSLRKRYFDLVVGSILLVLTLPLIILLSGLILVTVGWPIGFTQKRLGKNGKVFKIFKFRTMKIDADKEKRKFSSLNEADGPVFKIKNDPRFVGIGKFLSRTGMDELPQLINVIRGEMSLVGPRPLPLAEAKEVQKYYPWRHALKPGIFSLWVISGSHSLSFQTWMKLDKDYLKQGELSFDFRVILTAFSQAAERLIDSFFPQTSYASFVLAIFLLVFFIGIR